MEVTTIEELQEKMGLFNENNPLGIIYQSVEYTALYDMLKDYLITADFQLYYKYGNRILLRKYEHAFIMENYDRIKQAVTYALLTESYRLKTLITTTLLEYNPIDNYAISETIITTTTIASNTIKGTQTNDRNVGEKINTIENSKTTNIGDYSETGTNNTTQGQQQNTTTSSTTYGEQINDTDTTTNYGERKETGTTTMTKSPYNASDYKPREQSSTNNTKNAVTDVVQTAETIGTHTDTNTNTENLGQKIDTVSTSKQIDARTDKETVKNTNTQNPYNITDTIGERKDSNNRNDNIDKQRDAHGRYGYTTTQTLIQAERDISNLSIVEEIIKIILKTICNSVLYVE